MLVYRAWRKPRVAGPNIPVIPPSGVPCEMGEPTVLDLGFGAGDINAHCRT